MINVDGVIYGNFRCDISGSDLNRCWDSPIEQLYPQVYHIKQRVMSLESKVQLCLDLHTHGKDFGAFAYCCIESVECREIPRILGRYCSIFRYDACTFGISNEKKKTARAQIFNLTNNINTLTI